MSKDIKDYLHLYLGCEFETPKGSMKLCQWKAVGQVQAHREIDFTFHWFDASEVKPILRPLSDMTDEEKIGLTSIFGWYHNFSDDVGRCDQIESLFANNGFWNKVTNISGATWAKVTTILLKQGFDIFGLIEEELAIDKTKI